MTSVVPHSLEAVPEALLLFNPHTRSSWFAEAAIHVVNQAAVCGPSSSGAAMWSVCQQGTQQGSPISAALCALQDTVCCTRQHSCILCCRVMPIAKNWLVCYLMHLDMLALLSCAAVAWYTLVSFALGVICSCVICSCVVSSRCHSRSGSMCTLLLWVQCYNALYAILSRLCAMD